MNLKVKVTARELQGENEALNILSTIENSLSIKEQIILFFFFTRHANLFHKPFDKIPKLTGNTNQDFDILLETNKAEIKNILNIDFINDEFKYTEKMIKYVFSKHIKDNYSECSSYFAAITVHKLKQYFSNKNIYDNIMKESKILINSNCINDKFPIDLVSYKEKVLYDLCESKHTISSQKPKIITQIKK